MNIFHCRIEKEQHSKNTNFPQLSLASSGTSTKYPTHLGPLESSSL